MYDLVCDIDAYPQFLPWCGGSRILKHEGDVIEAELLIAKGGFKKAFSTRNRVENGRKMTISLLNGPFSYMEGEWNFTPCSAITSTVASWICPIWASSSSPSLTRFPT